MEQQAEYGGSQGRQRRALSPDRHCYQGDRAHHRSPQDGGARSHQDDQSQQHHAAACCGDPRSETAEHQHGQAAQEREVRARDRQQVRQAGDLGVVPESGGDSVGVSHDEARQQSLSVAGQRACGVHQMISDRGRRQLPPRSRVRRDRISARFDQNPWQDGIVVRSQQAAHPDLFTWHQFRPLITLRNHGDVHARLEFLAGDDRRIGMAGKDPLGRRDRLRRICLRHVRSRSGRKEIGQLAGGNRHGHSHGRPRPGGRRRRQRVRRSRVPVEHRDQHRRTETCSHHQCSRPPGAAPTQHENAERHRRSAGPRDRARLRSTGSQADQAASPHRDCHRHQTQVDRWGHFLLHPPLAHRTAPFTPSPVGSGQRISPARCPKFPGAARPS